MAIRAAQVPLPAGLRTVDEALHRTRFRVLPFLGPAFIACVAYIDPGNFATNIAAGSKFGYLLLWVVVAANLMAMLIQTLSAKLGIATGRNLPEVCREPSSRTAPRSCSGCRRRRSRWRPTSPSSSAPRSASTCCSGRACCSRPSSRRSPRSRSSQLQSFGFRPFEAAIAALVGLIGICYLIEIFYARPNLRAAGAHTLVPEFAGSESVLLAVGILGATVMPHVIYLHSALTQDRIVPESPEERPHAAPLHADRRARSRWRSPA